MTMDKREYRAGDKNINERLQLRRQRQVEYHVLIKMKQDHNPDQHCDRSGTATPHRERHNATPK